MPVVKSRSLALSATLALVLLPSQLPAAALPLLRTEWNASSAELGWVVSAYLLGYAAPVLVVLPPTDRIRPSLVLAIRALVTSLATLASSLPAHRADRHVQLARDPAHHRRARTPRPPCPAERAAGPDDRRVRRTLVGALHPPRVARRVPRRGVRAARTLADRCFGDRESVGGPSARARRARRVRRRLAVGSRGSPARGP